MLWLLACAAPEPPASWRPGELVIEQIGLGGLALGESALVVGPDGSSLLVDVGNDAHAEDVAAAVERHLGVRAVDRVLLTHYHADHIGALDELDVAIGEIVWRGPYDLGEGANLGEWEEACALDVPKVDLCTGGVPAPCELGGDGAPWPATACGGATIPLGEASVEIVAVNGFAGGEALALGHDAADDENARSLVGTIRLGAFAYGFAGDLTGGGKGTPDAEAWVLEQVELGAPDALHLSHHGIDSSTQAAWVDAMLPEDGVSRSLVVGSTGVYGAAPSQGVLDRVGPRLGEGAVWATETGMWAGEADALRVAGGAVLVRAAASGSYTIEAAGEVATFVTR